MLRVSVQLRSEAGPETPVIAGGAAHTHNEGVRLSRPAVSHWVGGTWNTHLNKGFSKMINHFNVYFNSVLTQMLRMVKFEGI